MEQLGITAQQLYSQWHIAFNLKLGRHVKRIKKFDKAMAKESWAHFERAAGMIHRNSGQIDYRLYMTALAEFHEGWFDPKILGSIRSMKIYKEYIATINENSSPQFIKESLFNSIRFVVNHCKKMGHKDLSDYMSEDIFLIPKVMKHYSAGSISPYFLAAINNFNIYIQNYPADAVDEYFEKYIDNHSKYRLRLINVKDLDRVYTRLDEVIMGLIKK